MQTDIILQAIHVAEIDNQRLHARLMNEQLRIARMNRPGLTTRIANTIGLTLIATGERLRKGEAHSRASQGGASIPRAV